MAQGRSEYAEILIRPRLIQIARKLPEKATPEEIAEALLREVCGSSARLTKGEVSLVFELMPVMDPEPDAPVKPEGAPEL